MISIKIIISYRYEISNLIDFSRFLLNKIDLHI